MKYIRHNGAWVPITAFARRAPVFPAIISDHMDALVHPATGQQMDSKSQFRRVTKERGYVELGNDAPTTQKPYEADPTIIKDVAQAYQMVEQGYRPPPVESVPELDGIDIRQYNEVQ